MPFPIRQKGKESPDLEGVEPQKTPRRLALGNQQRGFPPTVDEIHPAPTRKRQIKLMTMVPAEKVFRKGRTTLSEVDRHTPGYGTVQFFV